MAKEEKTNVMRILDQAHIEYNSYSYLNTEAISGIEVANILKLDPNRVFKTLVTIGKSGNYYVFDIPVKEELDLKKAASAVNEKNIEMIKQKELLNLTGYIHGGCSPIGMKKQFVTVFDETIELYDSIYFSAGKIGYQVEVNPNDLKNILEYSIYDLTK